MKVSVKNGLNNQEVGSATASLTFHKESGDGMFTLEQVGHATTNSEGIIVFPITCSGRYTVEVSF